MVDTPTKSNIQKLIGQLSEYLITGNTKGIKETNDAILKEALLSFDKDTLHTLISYSLKSLLFLVELPENSSVCCAKDVTVMALAFQAQLVEGIGYEKELWSKN